MQKSHEPRARSIDEKYSARARKKCQNESGEKVMQSSQCACDEVNMVQLQRKSRDAQMGRIITTSWGRSARDIASHD